VKVLAEDKGLEVLEERDYDPQDGRPAVLEDVGPDLTTRRGGEDEGEEAEVPLEDEDGTDPNGVKVRREEREALTQRTSNLRTATSSPPSASRARLQRVPTCPAWWLRTT
jgi:hypothetical protein